MKNLWLASSLQPTFLTGIFCLQASAAGHSSADFYFYTLIGLMPKSSKIRLRD